MAFPLLGVVIAAILLFVLGAVWFTPLFGRVWDRAIGYDRAAVGGRFPPSYYVVPLVGAAVIAAAVGALVWAIGTPGVLVGAATGGVVGAAAAVACVTTALNPAVPRPLLLGAVTAGYHLVGAAAAGAVIGMLA